LIFFQENPLLAFFLILLAFCGFFIQNQPLGPVFFGWFFKNQPLGPGFFGWFF